MITTGSGGNDYSALSFIENLGQDLADFVQADLDIDGTIMQEVIEGSLNRTMIDASTMSETELLQQAVLSHFGMLYYLRNYLGNNAKGRLNQFDMFDTSNGYGLFKYYKTATMGGIYGWHAEIFEGEIIIGFAPNPNDIDWYYAADKFSQDRYKYKIGQEEYQPPEFITRSGNPHRYHYALTDKDDIYVTSIRFKGQELYEKFLKAIGF